MANSIKESAKGLALQVTRSARRADLVDEDADGYATRLAGVYVFVFDGLLLVVDAERVSAGDRAELVASAAVRSASIHRGEVGSVHVAGNGYQVQLPGCEVAGFSKGDAAPVETAPGTLAVHDGQQSRLVADLVRMRQGQAAL